MTAYATRRDLYRYGLPRGVLGGAARLVDSSLAATDTITLDSHGFETDDEIVFRADTVLSAPLVAGTTYYAIRLNDSTFKVSATAEGSAINLTTDGVSMSVAAPLPADDVLEFYSRFVDGFLPAEATPLAAPYPITVVAIVAELAAKKLMQLAGHASALVSEAELSAKAQLERWATGVPLRDVTEMPANKAINSSLIVSSTDPRGWGTRTIP